MTHPIACLTAVGLLLVPSTAHAGATDRAASAITAFAIGPEVGAVRIDGELIDAAWDRAPVVKGFVQRTPREGEAASFDTEVRVAYDAAALYVAIDAIDAEPDRIVGILTRRDEPSPSDWVSVHLDSFHDRRSAFEFGVNATGVKYDRYWFNDASSDNSWDAVWDVAVRRHDNGWRAEFRIPFSQLRFTPSDDAVFGFAVARTIARLNETSTWPALPRSASGYVSSFGELTDLDLTGDRKRLELTPYVLAEATTSPVDRHDPLRRSPDPGATAGLDLKYAVAPGLMLTGTVNPDFGQIEADPAVVNLGAFETFFAERRPFFVEGSGALRFDIDCNNGACNGLFYSRRIGRAPQRAVGAPDGGFASQPANTTILGAAKLTGRIGAFSVGALHAVTGREYARLASGPGLATSDTPVEPLTNYSVLRVTRDFDDSSRIGIMATATRRGLPDALAFLPSTAITGGVDGDWRLGDRYSLNGFWAASTVGGSADAIARLQRNTVHAFQRPDAEHITYDPTRTRLSGHAAQLSFAKIGGQHTRFNVIAAFKSPGFDINDLGFQQRADEATWNSWFQIRDTTPGRIVREVNVNFNQWAGWNFDGDLRYWGGNVNANWTFTNNWQFATGVSYNGQGFVDRLTRGGPGFYSNVSLNHWINAQTDDRRRVVGKLNSFWFRDWHGSWQADLSPQVSIRPSSALLVTAGLGYTRNHAQSQWITNLQQADGAHYVFGRLEQSTVRLTARVNYTISPALSVQLYGQPFVSAGAYTAFKELADGRSKAYEGRYRPFAYAGQPDFNVRSFRTTNVLRWEFRPGSALFVVWQQGREDFASAGEFRFGRDFGDLFGTPATNTFLVKFSRWLNF